MLNCMQPAHATNQWFYVYVCVCVSRVCDSVSELNNATFIDPPEKCN